jgi:hypothetical protein
MAQTLPIAQTAYANVPTSNAKEPKFIMPEKFDGTQSKFRGFVHDDSIQMASIGSLLLGNVLFRFLPYLIKHLPVLQDMVQFEALFTTTFGDRDRERVVEIKMQSLCQGTQSVVIYAAEFQQLTCDFEWNNKAFINRF